MNYFGKKILYAKMIGLQKIHQSIYNLLAQLLKAKLFFVTLAIFPNI